MGSAGCPLSPSSRASRALGRRSHVQSDSGQDWCGTQASLVSLRYYSADVQSRWSSDDRHWGQ